MGGAGIGDDRQIRRGRGVAEVGGVGQSFLRGDERNLYQRRLDEARQASRRTTKGVSQRRQKLGSAGDEFPVKICHA